jgi:hypothetical protein
MSTSLAVNRDFRSRLATGPMHGLLEGSIAVGAPMKTNIAKAILSDSQFWIPLAVLALGIVLLACLY